MDLKDSPEYRAFVWFDKAVRWRSLARQYMQMFFGANDPESAHRCYVHAHNAITTARWWISYGKGLKQRGPGNVR